MVGESAGGYRTRTLCPNQMTNEGGHPSTGSHSASSIRRLVGLFRGAEPSRGHSGGPDQSYEQRGRTAAKKTGPCLEGPSPHKGPPYRVQIGSTNGALRWVPSTGPITTQQAPCRIYAAYIHTHTHTQTHTSDTHTPLPHTHTHTHKTMVLYLPGLQPSSPPDRPPPRQSGPLPLPSPPALHPGSRREAMCLHACGLFAGDGKKKKTA